MFESVWGARHGSYRTSAPGGIDPRARVQIAAVCSRYCRLQNHTQYNEAKIYVGILILIFIVSVIIIIIIFIFFIRAFFEKWILK